MSEPENNGISENFNKHSLALSAEAMEMAIYKAYKDSVLESSKKPVIFIEHYAVDKILQNLINKAGLTQEKFNLKGFERDNSTPEEIEELKQNIIEPLLNYLIQENPEMESKIREIDPQYLIDAALTTAETPRAAALDIQDLCIVSIDSHSGFYESLKNRLHMPNDQFDFEFVKTLYSDFVGPHEADHCNQPYMMKKFIAGGHLELIADKAALKDSNLQGTALGNILEDFRILNLIQPNYNGMFNFWGDWEHGWSIKNTLPENVSGKSMSILEKMPKAFEELILKGIMEDNPSWEEKRCRSFAEDLIKDDRATLYSHLEKALETPESINEHYGSPMAELLQKYLETQRKYDPQLGGTPPKTSDLLKSLKEVVPENTPAQETQINIPSIERPSP